MKMADPVPQFTHFVTSLKSKHPNLAYIHLIEPRISAGNDVEDPNEEHHVESNDFIRAIWQPRPLISAGGFSRESALNTAEEKGGLIAFGRFYISNVGLLSVDCVFELTSLYLLA
jgi:NADPH2 dehydrogenase